MKHQIRSARLADAEGIAKVHVESWRWAYDGLMPAELLAGLDVASRSKQWQQQLAAGQSSVFVADVAGAIHGFASYGPSRDPEGLAEIYAIYLLREAQGTGMGSELWAAATDVLRNQGYSQLQVWVLDSNQLARDFYERSGLAADGGRKTSQWAGTNLSEVSYSGPLT